MFSRRKAIKILNDMDDLYSAVHFLPDIPEEIKRRVRDMRTNLNQNHVSDLELKRFNLLADDIEKMYVVKQDRMELAHLLVGDLKEGSNNTLVLEHIKTILPVVTTIFESKSKGERLFHNSLQNASDVAQAVQDIAAGRYFYALTRLEDFLLRRKQEETEVSEVEIFTIYTILTGMVLES